jgi:hypothetical protein
LVAPVTVSSDSSGSVADTPIRELQVRGRDAEEPEVAGGDQVGVGAQGDVVNREHRQGLALGVDDPGGVDVEPLGIDAEDQVDVDQHAEVDAASERNGAAERVEVEVRRTVERLVDGEVEPDVAGRRVHGVADRSGVGRVAQVEQVLPQSGEVGDGGTADGVQVQAAGALLEEPLEQPGAVRAVGRETSPGPEAPC